MDNFLEMPIDGRYLSSDIELENGSREKLDRDIIDNPFDLVQSVDLIIERSHYLGNGIARVNYLSKRNCYGEYR